MMRNCLDATDRAELRAKKRNIELRGQERANLAMNNFATLADPFRSWDSMERRRRQAISAVVVQGYKQGRQENSETAVAFAGHR